MADRINTLIVEDDPMVLEIHERFVRSTEGFAVAAAVRNGNEALKVLDEREIDLMILDIYMPGLDGLQTLEAIRSGGAGVDVIVVSAAHEVDTFTRIIRCGAFDYIVKPFTYERLCTSLAAYREFRRALQRERAGLNQEEIDTLLRRRGKEDVPSELPKGLSPRTLKSMVDCLKESASPLSAHEAADGVGVSRVTARRYLEFLVDTGEATVRSDYRDIGRPVNRYSLLQ